MVLSAVCAMMCAIAPAATFTVTSSADSGAGTLRQAILDANSTSGADTIEFDSGVSSITLTSTVLPSITETVTIDGTLNHAAGTFIELNGNSLTGDGLSLGAEDCDVYGMYIHGFAGRGIDCAAAGAIIGNATKRNVISANTSDGIRCGVIAASIQGNYIGTDTTGLVDNGNGGSGVNILGPLVVVQGNVISGNDVDGITATSTFLEVYGNTIGLGSDGSTLIPNSSQGINITTTCDGATIGDGTPAGRNIISGNSGSGISFAGTNGMIEGNYLGCDATGSVVRGNGSSGIFATSVSTLEVRGNVLSGNSIGMNSDSDALSFYGNLAGLTADGTAQLSNTQRNLFLAGASSNSTIGSANPADRNYFGRSAGTQNVYVRGSGHVIEGNFIGTDISGTTDINSNGWGIECFASSNTI